MLECPKCKFNNELGRIFCHQCGTKLDLSQIKPPTEGAKMRRRVKRNVARTTRTLIELAIAGVLILGIVALCLVPAVKSVDPTNAELMAADTMRMDLERLVNSAKGGTMTITENQLNTFLNTNFEKPKGQGLEVSPTVLRATFANGSIKLEFVGVIHFGTFYDKSLYFGYTGEPVVVDGKFSFRPSGGWIGKLPVHPKILAVVPFIDNAFGQMFQNLKEDAELLDKLTSLTITPEGAQLTKGAAK